MRCYELESAADGWAGQLQPKQTRKKQSSSGYTVIVIRVEGGPEYQG